MSRGGVLRELFGGSRIREEIVARARRWRASAEGSGRDGGVELLDARLLPAALACWGVTIAVLIAGWRVGIALVGVSVLAAVGVWWAARRRRRVGWTRVVSAALLLVAGFGLAAAWREHRVVQHPLRDAIGKSVSVVVTPNDDPKAVRAGGFGGQRMWVVRAGLETFEQGGAEFGAGGAVVILGEGEAWSRVPPGRAIEFRARVEAARFRDLTVVTLRATGAPRVAGDLPWWQRAAISVRADLSAAASEALPDRAAGLLPALVVGDTSTLPDAVRSDFETAGLQHLTVVSGTNFTILLTVVLFAVRLVGLGPRMAAAVAGAGLIMFVVVARPDPSVLRAGAMGAVTLLALVTGRRKQALPALCAAVIGLLAWQPQLAASAGFALSVVATAGLILLAPTWVDRLRACGWWRLPAELVAVSAAAFVVTTPILVALSGRVNPIAVLANILVAPVVAPVTVIGAAGAATAWLSPTVAEIVLRAAAPPMWWLLTVAAHSATVPGASVTVPGGTIGGIAAAVAATALVLVLRISAIRRLAATALLGCTAILVPVHLWHPGWPPRGWAFAACDVGQGDALALSVDTHSAVVVDAGPDPHLIDTCLHRLHIDHIPLLVLTHPHADHIAGLTGALRNRTVAAIATAPHELDIAPADQSTAAPVGPSAAVPVGPSAIPAPIWPPASTQLCGRQPDDSRSDRTCDPTSDDHTADPGAGRHHRKSNGDHGGDAREDAEGAAEVRAIADRAGIPILELSEGHLLEFGPLRLEVLAPAISNRPRAGSDGTETNDRSVVLTATTEAGRILLTGDIEESAQRRLTTTDPAAVRADILKVPHHGSRTTTREFLAAVAPRLAIVSAGADNPFGHPHPRILTDLDQLGATTFRTDNCGDILVFGPPHSPRTATSRSRARTVLPRRSRIEARRRSRGGRWSGSCRSRIVGWPA